MLVKKKMFLLGGAPKCGTSSVFNWFQYHPNIVPVKNKEVFFFIDSKSPLKNETINSYDKYFSLYKSSSKGYYLDGTTHLLYQGVETMDMIKTLPLETKFVFVLRHPIARLYSSFNYTKNNLLRISGQFTYNDYVTCLRTGDFTSLEDNITDATSLYVLKNDLEYGRYSTYLSLWYSKFPKDSIKIILFEEMKNDVKKSVTDICDFLDVSATYFHDYQFNTDNETITIGNRKLFGYAKKMSFLMPKGQIKNKIKKIFGSKKMDNLDHLEDCNSEFLKRFYSSEVSSLQKLGLDLNFPIWDDI